MGDDASTRAPLEPGAKVRFVKYDGKTLTALPQCTSDFNASFGAYACRTFMDSYDGTFEIDDTRVLCQKYPLAATTLGPHVAVGTTMRVTVGVAAVCTSTRATIHRSEIAGIDGCAGATHFVSSYDLGALRVALGDTAVAAESRGDLAKCASSSARELMACKVPVHASLRPIVEGAPVAAPPPPPVVSAPDAGAPVASAPDAGAPVASAPDAGAPEESIDDARSACIVALNNHRKDLGLRYLLRNAPKEACADEDAKKLAGAPATTGPGACGAKAHNVCSGRGTLSSVAAACADEIFREGRTGARYQNMTNTKWPLVYCGFAKMPDGTVYVVQNFGEP